PGSFDPLTNGHLNILRRAARLFDELIVVVGDNPRKRTMFSVAERSRIVREATADLGNVRVDSFKSMLLVDYALAVGAGVIVKGLRNIGDFQNEFQQYNMNSQMAPSLETLFLLADGDEIFVSSSLVREMIRENADYELFVPGIVEEEVEGRR
ncbi:MAG TPA: pantetheine-phosphate adenylyltransferase, partial [Ardenticatenaceae bacterium]|nr:pantetheine-phosphate adenylyltransferase [Ardenticatenaceae bacterium]